MNFLRACNVNLQEIYIQGRLDFAVSLHAIVSDNQERASAVNSAPPIFPIVFLRKVLLHTSYTPLPPAAPLAIEPNNFKCKL